MTTVVTATDLDNRLLTWQGVAEILGVGRSTVFKLHETGKLPYVKVLGARRTALSDVMAFIEANKTGGWAQE